MALTGQKDSQRLLCFRFDYPCKIVTMTELFLTEKKKEEKFLADFFIYIEKNFTDKPPLAI